MASCASVAVLPSPSKMNNPGAVIGEWFEQHADAAANSGNQTEIEHHTPFRFTP